MKNIKEKNIKKIFSSWIVLCLILTGVVMTTAPSVVASCNTCTDTPTVRIYGEEAAVYPTHSFTDDANKANDFVYLDETQPFDPGVIQKDSITFNSAWLGHIVNGQGDAAEKVFLRAFYEPYYWHNEDLKMSNYGSYSLRPILYYEPGDFHAVVTETTYFLTSLEREPKVGYPGYTNLILPYKSSNPNIPGMDEHGYVDVVECDYRQSVDWLTDGAIRIEKEFMAPTASHPTFEFMDHKIEIISFEDGNEDINDQLLFNITYTGNPYGVEDNFGKTETYELSENEYCPLETPVERFFNRDNKMKTIDPYASNPEYRWYLRVDTANPDVLRITLGRWLVAGETFYVDGVRYDMPAIYVDADCGFKFITLQTPYPKAEYDDTGSVLLDKDDYVDDFTHVTSQYLYRLPKEQPVWLLYPFNVEHLMIDDIGIEKTYCDPPYYYSIPTKGILLDQPVPALEFWWISEEIEERFDSSLTERLRTWESSPGRDLAEPPEECDDEQWHWWNVYTLPNSYTEFHLPDQEMIGDYYDLMDIPEWYTYLLNYDLVDGNEYLITESYIAPNAEANWNRDDTCKYVYEHEIVDKCWNLISWYKSGHPDYMKFEQYHNWARMVYEHDAIDGKDLYINEYDCQCSDQYEATVRIYGEEDYYYPTHSYTEGFDYIYKEETDPFDPGIIAKDSITFNSAWLGHDFGINAQGNAAEKVFLRGFYEPEYYHPCDIKMDNAYLYPVDLLPIEEFNALVTETTYFLTTLDREPTVGFAGNTKFVMPFVSYDEMIPGMDKEGLLDVAETRSGGPMLTDGAIKVEKEFFAFNYDQPEFEFMDHKIKILDFEDGNENENDLLLINVTYTGNPEENGMEDNFGKTETYELSEDEYCGQNKEPVERYFSRDNKILDKMFDTNPAYRWYLRVESASTTSLRITLGRWLFAGETFYVDGVRYDMPAIYVTNDNCAFKYITLQTPIPKADMPGQDKYTYVEDFTHVTSQYLYRLEKCKPAWMLFPFNTDHVMIDDIGIEQYPGACPEVPLKGILLKDLVGELKFAWVEETIEERFNTSLTERLDTVEMCEDWEWWNVYTKPYRYTELALIDQEMDGGRSAYDIDDIPDWYSGITDAADGNEYLIATSWIAQNCWDEYKWELCKPEQTHDIIDIYMQYILPNELYQPGFDYAPKMTFEFDASDGTGLFINQICNTPDPDPLTCFIDMPTSANTGDQVTITGFASGGTTPYMFEWDLDNDGQYDDDTGKVITYTWTTTGAKNVRMKVTDSGSGSYEQECTDIETISISQTGGGGGCCDMTLAISNLVTCQDPSTVTITIPDAVDVTIASFRLEWDNTKFSLGTVTPNQGAGMGQWDLIQSSTGDDYLIIDAYKYWPGHDGAVDIVTVEFIPIGNPGDSTLLDLLNAQLWAGQYATPVDSIDVIDGTATINCGGSSYDQGDYNTDGVVNQVDVYLLGMAVVQYGANPPGISPEADVDMNDDGIINQADVYLLGMQVIQS